MIEIKFKRTPKLGLALSGGGARGLAHIGVLKALEEAGIPVDYLAGTSMGGLIAAVYASGKSPTEIEALAAEMSDSRNLLRLADPKLPRHSLFEGEQLRIYMDEILEGRNFSELKIPLTLVAVDLNAGDEVLIQDGSVSDGVRATISIPGLFSPVERDGQRLVDGGLLNSLPVNVARQMGADIVLAVDIGRTNVKDSYAQSLASNRILAYTIGGLVSVLGDSLDVLIKKHRQRKLADFPPDFLIEPDIPLDVTIISGYSRATEIIPMGVAALEAVLPALQEAQQPRLGVFIHRTP